LRRSSTSAFIHQRHIILVPSKLPLWDNQKVNLASITRVNPTTEETKINIHWRIQTPEVYTEPMLELREAQ
jgi:hypothetical protein